MNSTNELTLTQAITNHPFLSSLSQAHINQLVSLFKIREFKSGDVIINEGDTIDHIGCIQSGTVEVSKHHVDKNNNISYQPLNVLNPGEFIGMSHSGFYSQTGRRTATVIALTDVAIWQIDIHILQDFISKVPNITTEFRKHVDLFNKMNLIKQAAPFAKISNEKIAWLAEHIKSISIFEGDFLFQKGEEGDECYLIRDGEINIINIDDNGHESVIATLTSPAIFGEAALLTSAPRNASAKASKNTKVFALKRDSLLKVLKSEKSLTNTLHEKLKAISHPKKLPQIEVFTKETNDLDTIAILKNPTDGSYFQLSEEGEFIWSMLDGKHSIRDIATQYANKYDEFDPAMISDFILGLEDEGFIEKSASLSNITFLHLPWWMKFFTYLRMIMEASYSFGDVDAWVTRSYNRFFKYFFYKTPQVIFAIITIFGAITFAATFHSYAELFKETKNTGWLIYFAFLISMATTIIHELGHAYTTKFLGRSVYEFGVGWFWFGPVAFCDTSDMWLSSKQDRLLVDCAGLYVDLIMSAIAILLTLVVTEPSIIIFLWLVALYNYLAVFLNLSPNIELDGYYILSDLTGKDDLRESAIDWLLNHAKKTFKSMKMIKEFKAELLYWSICLAYLVAQAVIPYIVLNYLLYGLLGTKSPIISLIVPTILVSLSTISIWVEIKKRRRED